VEKINSIIAGCLKNDRQKQGELYKLFAPRMYAVCLRYTANAFDAQDVLQEGFIKIFSNLKNFRATGSLEGWMKKIFIHLALDKYRSKINHLSVDEMGDHDNPEDQDASALDTLSEKEIIAYIRELPDQYRMVFNLYVLEGLSHNEISQEMNIGVSTSRSNLARARTLLKEKIEDQSRWIEKAI
jgi:RNA polymerase sigma factor (sigma-70 family)